jgi:hypothetical protein
VQAQESRTAKRIEELLGSPPAVSRHENLSGDNGSTSPKVERRSPMLDAVRHALLPLPPDYEEATGRSTSRTPMLQSSVGKRNITQRRSKGRSSRDDGTTAPDPSIVA